MKYYILILALAVVMVSGCISPEEINKQIADTYAGLSSLSYDVRIVRTDVYERSYTAYEFMPINEPPYVSLGESHTLTGSSSEEQYSVFIEKPDKKAIWGSGSYQAHIGGGELIEDTWYYMYSPSGEYPSTRRVCKNNEYSSNQDVPAIPGVYESCEDWIQNSIWRVPQDLDNETKYIVNISRETTEGREVIKAHIRSATDDFFYIENIDIPFQEIDFWFESESYKLVKFEGTLRKSKTENEGDHDIGLSTTYKMYFENMVFNPQTPTDMFGT
jgi:hypothetical protein